MKNLKTKVLQFLASTEKPYSTDTYCIGKPKFDREAFESCDKLFVRSDFFLYLPLSLSYYTSDHSKNTSFEPVHLIKEMTADMGKTRPMLDMDDIKKLHDSLI